MKLENKDKAYSIIKKIKQIDIDIEGLREHEFTNVGYKDPASFTSPTITWIELDTMTKVAVNAMVKSILKRKKFELEKELQKI